MSIRTPRDGAEDATLPGEARTGGSVDVDATIAGDEAPRVEERPLAQGDLVGRYVVLGKLGAGAMGVVHVAYDPELDRRVALKLLHPRRRLSGGSAGAERTRLIREAQAMAKLAHPSVVTVHDVGEHEGRVFLAMEYVDGCTLRDWLARERRPWREIVDVLQRAGQGLAAAHRAGLVHRDFKPDNVMVAPANGRLERVLVMDFGLARPDHDTSEPETSSMDVSSPKIAALAHELTADGAIVGTPAYMPVEQLAGRRADARADQFAFGVTLFEALYRRRPFAPKDLGGLAFAIVEGKIEPPPADSRVPRWIHRAIERALRPEPDDRFASMDELLAALQHAPARRLRAGLAAGLVVAIAGGTWGLLQLADGRTRAQCRDQADAIATLWNDDIASAIGQSFAELDAPWAAKAWPHDEERLAAYAASWAGARERVCLGATLDRTMTPAVAAAATRCLDERIDQMAALIEQLSEPDLTIASSTRASIAALPPVERCEDETWVARWHVDDEASSEEAARLRRDRQRVVVMVGLSQAAEARQEARALQARAEALGLHGLALELRMDAADAAVDLPDYAAAEREFWEAYLAAVAAARDDLALRAISGHTYVAGYLQARPADGMRSGELGNALIERLALQGSNEEAALLASWAPVHIGAGRLSEARRLIERMLEILRATLGDDHPRVAMTLGMLASVLSSQGADEEALAAHLEALAATRATFGPEHPTVTTRLNNIAGVLLRYGRYAEAESYVEEARAHYQAWGSDVAVLAGVLINSGTLERNTGRPREALGHYREALEIFRKSAPNSTHVGDVLTDIGIAYADLGDDESALTHHREAHEAFVTAYGREHARSVAALINIGSGLVGLDRFTEGRQVFEEALDIARRLEATEEMAAVALTNLAVMAARDGDHATARRHAEESLRLKEKILGPDHPRVALTLLTLARELRALGEHEHVQAHLERALAIFEKGGITHDRGAVRFELAQVIADRDPERARTLAEQARADFAQAGPVATKALANVEKWLANR